MHWGAEGIIFISLHLSGGQWHHVSFGQGLINLIYSLTTQFPKIVTNVSFAMIELAWNSSEFFSAFEDGVACLCAHEEGTSAVPPMLETWSASSTGCVAGHPPGGVWRGHLDVRTGVLDVCAYGLKTDPTEQHFFQNTLNGSI